MTHQIKYTSTPITYSYTPATIGSSSSSNAPGGNAPTPGGNAPAILPPPAATAISTNITHIVALDERNRDYFANSPSTFSRMRVTIHTTGAWPNSPHSDNHVTILLILNEGGAVQVNMRTDAGDRRGQLEWKRVNYQHSNSEIKFVDYDLGAPVQVNTLYTAIRNDWKLHQYLFSAGGSGCHFWNYVLLRKMADDTNRFSLHADVPNHAWGVFSKWYSRTGAERENQPILQGEFQSDTEWWNDWFE
ncbi:hypothetical protein DM02DRAFT_41538 [Periconia macrospinosa]|uniref:DUF7770 domain-containing protein n=1 Tax=Periconia macrospinosa TaxID=97972 RepID=A0A2V1DKP4_9PLEO|nr:hypothetical protein DM02DRAFT_41538 [Periconia macrospinosa]